MIITKKNNKLNNAIRSTLVDLIIGEIITKKIPMSVSLAESIANQIVAMFQSEMKVGLIIMFYIFQHQHSSIVYYCGKFKDLYFMKIGNNKNPKGKLYIKYYNSMRSLKSSGLVESSSVQLKRNNLISSTTDRYS